jgi:hypothetical protein
MPKYILDPGVEDELWGIWPFIAQDDPDAATRVIEAAYENAADNLTGERAAVKSMVDALGSCCRTVFPLAQISED